MTWHIKKFQLPFLIDKVKKLWSKEIALVKVAWHNHENDKATWEVEMKSEKKYPHYLRIEVSTYSNSGTEFCKGGECDIPKIKQNNINNENN